MRASPNQEHGSGARARSAGVCSHRRPPQSPASHNRPPGGALPGQIKAAEEEQGCDAAVLVKPQRILALIGVYTCLVSCVHARQHTTNQSYLRSQGRPRLHDGTTLIHRALRRRRGTAAS
ncbi:hypothetical protein BDA96_04G258600 [Sorghum bicolor]|uniref:Uncharacterized protein n=2 Tax=Sorghum bicolor TaxID=4558 RepID=A0A921UJB2_SORBI|nr:hypothetical protein BDA96_04G258600 [Sorghum bicolor]OQU85438.1 hypothetical protein SORBI_3004G242850 [Sorghum bicolor]